jgi:hypothetical protein
MPIIKPVCIIASTAKPMPAAYHPIGYCQIPNFIGQRLSVDFSLARSENPAVLADKNPAATA